jgi:uncharacterized membrane protein YedE/YeeE
MRAHFLLFALTALLFFPFLKEGEAFGQAVQGFLVPLGVALFLGAFLFGLGMQLGDGCASGTLYHTGSGDSRGVLVLLGFMAGSLLGVYHLPFWQGLPAWAPGSALTWFPSPYLGLALWLGLLGGLYLGVSLVEKRRRGKVEPLFRQEATHPLLGPWSLVGGAVVLALGSLLLLLLQGRPWGVTAAFALWGGKLAEALGVPVLDWALFNAPDFAEKLQDSVLRDPPASPTSASSWGPSWGPPWAGPCASRTSERFPGAPIWGSSWAGCSWATGPGWREGATSGPTWEGRPPSASTGRFGGSSPSWAPPWAFASGPSAAWRTS